MQLVDVVVRNYSSVFPELRAARDVIHACIVDEETSFSRTLLKGIDRFKKQAEALKKEGKAQVRLCLLGSGAGSGAGSSIKPGVVLRFS